MITQCQPVVPIAFILHTVFFSQLVSLVYQSTFGQNGGVLINDFFATEFRIFLELINIFKYIGEGVHEIRTQYCRFDYVNRNVVFFSFRKRLPSEVNFITFFQTVCRLFPFRRFPIFLYKITITLIRRPIVIIVFFIFLCFFV